MNAITQAAAARAAGVAQRSHRPSQRRTATGGHAAGFAADVSIRLPEEGSTLIGFRGYASTYEQPYEMCDVFGPYAEIVSAGAAATSLARADLDVPLVLGHDQMRRIARTTTGTLRLSEDDHGLNVEADLDPRDPDADYAIRKLAAGLYDEMSFAFRIVKGSWSQDFTEYRIDQVDLHRGDVSLVGWGANPTTSAGLRAAPDLATRLALAAAL